MQFNKGGDDGKVEAEDPFAGAGMGQYEDADIKTERSGWRDVRLFLAVLVGVGVLVKTGLGKIHTLL